jgi:hypothetical protein
MQSASMISAVTTTTHTSLCTSGKWDALNLMPRALLAVSLPHMQRFGPEARRCQEGAMALDVAIQPLPDLLHNHCPAARSSWRIAPVSSSTDRVYDRVESTQLGCSLGFSDTNNADLNNNDAWQLHATAQKAAMRTMSVQEEEELPTSLDVNDNYRTSRLHKGIGAHRYVH